MTGQEEIALLRDYCQTCTRLLDGLQRAIDQAVPLMPVDPITLGDMPVEDENFILAHLKRYEQFEDALGRTIKTGTQMMALGKPQRLEPRDVANKAEGYGIIDDADCWSEAVRARNALIHEYPLRADKRASRINNAWEANATLMRVWTGLQRFIEEEGLLS